MRSIFALGFEGGPWSPATPPVRRSLGQWGAIISAAIQAGAAAYGAYQQREIAEEMKEAAEAKAAAERAAAEAERKRAEEEAKKAAAAAAAAAGTPAPGAPSDTVLGLPRDVVVYGGLGLGVLGIAGLVIALAK